MLKALRATAMILAVGVLADVAGAQPAPLGPEIEIDPRLAGQFVPCPAVAGRDDGGFAVAWFRYFPPHQNGPRSEILSRAGEPGAVNPSAT